jgi:PAS domain S-box-containing protein
MVKRNRDSTAPMPKGIDAAVLSPELRTLFDRMADHFPGHTMQRVRLPDRRIRYTYASPGMRETFGIDPASVLAEETATHDWIHESDRDRFLAALHRSGDKLETLDEEVRVTGADGRMRWVRSIGHPRAMLDGGIVWDGIALDVTARRETEAALERMAALTREAETAPSGLITGEAGRVGRSLAEIGRHLDALEAAVPLDARRHLEAVRLELSALLRPAKVNTPPKLTPRQTSVLALVGEGVSNRDIGKRLGIDAGTAKLHVAAILERLHVPNRTAAAAAARRMGLI